MPLGKLCAECQDVNTSACFRCDVLARVEIVTGGQKRNLLQALVDAAWFLAAHDYSTVRLTRAGDDFQVETSSKSRAKFSIVEIKRKVAD